MRRAVLCITLCVTVSAIGCRRGEGESTTPDTEGGGGTGESFAATPTPPPPPPPTEVSLRLIHAAASASKVPVSATFTAEEGDQPLAEALEFGSTSAYSEATLAPDSTKIAMAVTAEGFEAPSGEQPVSDGAHHTFIVFSAPDTTDQLDLAVTLDEGSGPEEGMKARFFHALVGWDAVDVCTPGATSKAPGEPVFTNVGYGGFASIGYQPIPPETKQLKIRVANEETPCSGKVIGGVTLQPPEGVDPSGKNLTLIAIGRAKGRPAVAKALLVCTDSPDEAPACFRLPMKAR